MLFNVIESALLQALDIFPENCPILEGHISDCSKVSYGCQNWHQALVQGKIQSTKVFRPGWSKEHQKVWNTKENYDAKVGW